MRRMRVPLQDLMDEKTRQRMRILAGAGHLFHVHSYGVPAAGTHEFLRDHADLVHRLEIVINWEKAGERIKEISLLAAETGLPIYLSRVNRKDNNKYTGGRYNHLINHGFTLDEAEELQAFFDANAEAAAVSGVMFNVMRDVEPLTAAMRAAGDRTSKLRARSRTSDRRPPASRPSAWARPVAAFSNCSRGCGRRLARRSTRIDASPSQSAMLRRSPSVA